MCVGHEHHKKVNHLFSIFTSSDKMTQHVWECQRIDISLKGKKTPLTNNPLITEQLQSASRYKSLIGLELVEKMKYFFIRWVVTMHIAFSICNNEFFKDLLGLFSKTLVKHLSTSSNTIRK